MNPTDLTQLVGSLNDLAAQGSKTGVKSSEFWLHVVSLIPMALTVAGVAATPVGLGATALSLVGSAIYSACRSNVKATGLQVVAAAAPAVAQAINSAVVQAPK